jgi:hypothetical protein
VDVNFKEAAIRHFEDAEHLFVDGRNANAGQLYGFCAECGLKALLVAYGLATKANGDLQGNMRSNQFMKHINGLVANVSTFSPADSTYFSYIAKVPNISAFTDWRVEHRYFLETALPTSHSAWRIAATQIRSMIDQAFLDGRIR